jgi:hypothetical protein
MAAWCALCGRFDRSWSRWPRHLAQLALSGLMWTSADHGRSGPDRLQHLKHVLGVDLIDGQLVQRPGVLRQHHAGLMFHLVAAPLAGFLVEEDFGRNLEGRDALSLLGGVRHAYRIETLVELLSAFGGLGTRLLQ